MFVCYFQVKSLFKKGKYERADAAARKAKICLNVGLTFGIIATIIAIVIGILIASLIYYIVMSALGFFVLILETIPEE